MSNWPFVWNCGSSATWRRIWGGGVLRAIWRTSSSETLMPSLLERALERGLELRVPHDPAVHLENDVSPAAQDLGDLAVGEPADKADGHDPKDGLRNLAHVLHHRGMHLRRAIGRCLSLSATTRRLKRRRVIPIDSGAGRTLSLSKSAKNLGRGLHQRDRPTRAALQGEPEGAEFRSSGRRLSQSGASR